MRLKAPIRGVFVALAVGVFFTCVAASSLRSDVSDTLLVLSTRLDGQRWLGYCQDLSGARPISTAQGPVTLTTRHTFSPQNQIAATWLEQTLTGIGTAARQIPFEEHAHTVRNVCALLPGEGPERVVVGAHFDSRAQDLDRREMTAPGAVDNATGVATVLELARVVQDTRRQATLEFCFYTGEEQGLYGSRHHARALKAAGTPVKGVLILDMVGQRQQYPGLVVEGRLRDVGFLWGVAGVMEQVEGLEVVPHYYSYDSDHVPYQRQGFSAVLLIERNWDRYRQYHESADTMEYVDVKTGMLIARAALAALIDLAGVTLHPEQAPLPLPHPGVQ